MIEKPARIKTEWWWAVVICLVIGILALIPGLIDYRGFWPWFPFSSVALWVISGILYWVGRWVTGKRLRQPPLR